MKWFHRKERAETPISPEEHEKNKKLAEDAAMYAMFASNTQPGPNSGATPKSGSFDISNSQKIAAYNLLMNSRDD